MKWATVALFTLSALAFGLSELGRTKKAFWLLNLDRVACFIFLSIGLLTLENYGLNTIQILALTLASSSILSLTLCYQESRLAYQLVSIVSFIEYGALGLFLVTINPEEIPLVQIIPCLIGSAVVLAGVYAYSSKRVKTLELAFTFGNPFELIFASISLLVLVLMVPYGADVRILLGVISILLAQTVWRYFIDSKTLDLSHTVVSIGLFFFLFLDLHVTKHDLSYALILYTGLLTVGLTTLILEFKKNKRSEEWIGSLMVGIGIFSAAHYFLIDRSVLAPSLIWILLSALFVFLREFPELRFIRSSITALGLVGIGLFAFHFSIVGVGDETLVLDFFEARLISEILSLGVLLYWIFFSSEKDNKLSGKLGEALTHCILYLPEVFTALLTYYVLAEVPNSARPLTWSLLGVAYLISGKRFQSIERFQLYSFWYYFGSLFHIAFVASSLGNMSDHWSNQPWVLASTAMAVSTVFLVWNYKKKPETTQALPSGLPSLMLSRINKGLRLKTLSYPLFIALALFLFWSFDQTLLSLLWMIECFFIFLLSIYTRESHFRAVSMTAIIGILLRMVFHDLVDSDFLVKAIVFILSGGILILMNIIYSRYKGRYEEK